MRKIVVGLIGALAAFSPAVHAATLIGVSGQVLVNRGNGFELAQTGQDLKPGDIVVANPGSVAQIIYPEGCLAPVSPGVIVSVAAKAPCAPLETGAIPAPALGLGPLLLGGGGAAAGGVGIAAALSKSGSNSASPASP